MQALAIRETSYGAMHPEVAQSMANLAVVYHAMKNLQKAGSFYSGALKIYKRFRDADDPEMQTVQENYNALCASSDECASTSGPRPKAQAPPRQVCR